MATEILQYRRLRAEQLIVAQDLPVSTRNLFSHHRYRARGLAEWPQDIILDFIVLHPPVVIKHPDGFHAIGNLRSVELAGYLHPKLRIPVLVHSPVAQRQLLAQSAALEFVTMTFGALPPGAFEQSALALWELYKSHERFPGNIRSKIQLAQFLSVNRRTLSQAIPEDIQPTYRSAE